MRPASTTVLAELLLLNTSVKRVDLSNQAFHAVSQPRGRNEWSAVARTHACQCAPSANSSRCSCRRRTLELLVSHATRFGQSGADALATMLESNKTLQSLSLYSTDLSSSECRVLIESLRTARLRELEFGANKLGPNGGKSLGEALKHNRHLRKLGIDSSALDNSGAVAIAQGLETNTVLSDLQMRDCGIRNRGGIFLAKALEVNSTLVRLDIADNYAACFEMAAALRTNSTLSELCLDRNCIKPPVAYAIAAALPDNKGLQRLSLAGNLLDAIAMATLSAQLPRSSLAFFNVGGQEAVPVGAFRSSKAAPERSSVSSVSSVSRPAGGGRGSKSKKSSSSAPDGELTNVAGVANTEMVAEEVAAEEVVDLSQCRLGHDASVVLRACMPLLEHSPLKELNLAGNPRLRFLGEPPLDKILSANASLKTLTLRDVAVGPAGGRAIATGLQRNACLTVLDLTNSHVGSVVDALALALKSNTTLQALSLAQNGISTAGAVAFGEGLRSNTALQVVDLRYNWLDASATDAVVKGANGCTSLKVLSGVGRRSGMFGGWEAIKPTLATDAAKPHAGVRERRGRHVLGAAGDARALFLTASVFEKGPPVESSQGTKKPPRPVRIDSAGLEAQVHTALAAAPQRLETTISKFEQAVPLMEDEAMTGALAGSATAQPGDKVGIEQGTHQGLGGVILASSNGILLVRLSTELTVSVAVEDAQLELSAEERARRQKAILPKTLERLRTRFDAEQSRRQLGPKWEDAPFPLADSLYEVFEIMNDRLRAPRLYCGLDRKPKKRPTVASQSRIKRRTKKGGAQVTGREACSKPAHNARALHPMPSSESSLRPTPFSGSCVMSRRASTTLPWRTASCAARRSNGQLRAI